MEGLYNGSHLLAETCLRGGVQLIVLLGFPPLFWALEL